MEEKKSVIQVYTIVFFLFVAGFVGFLIYQGYKDSEIQKKYSPREKVRKSRTTSLLQVSLEEYLKA
jgi:hypothetical protein